jgi:hypothetical protein
MTGERDSAGQGAFQHGGRFGSAVGIILHRPESRDYADLESSLR